MPIELYANNAVTTLTVAVVTTPAALTAETWDVVSSAAPLPQAVTGVSQWRATVSPTITDNDPEIVMVTNNGSGTLDVLRGIEGSTVKTHAVGDVLTMTLTKGNLPSPDSRLYVQDNGTSPSIDYTGTTITWDNSSAVVAGDDLSVNGDVQHVDIATEGTYIIRFWISLSVPNDIVVNIQPTGTTVGGTAGFEQASGPNNCTSWNWLLHLEADSQLSFNVSTFGSACTLGECQLDVVRVT